MSGRDSWGALSEQWKAILDENHVPVFHYADLAEDRRSREGSPYHGWDQARIDRFMVRLAEVARDQTMVGVGGLVAAAEFNELVAPVLPDELRHPYYACVPLCLKTLYLTIKREYPLDAIGERILVFLDEQQEFKALTLQFYDDFRREFDPRHRLFGEITWGSKEELIPLQAADLLAARARKVVTRTIQGRSGVNAGSWDEVLASAGRLRITHHDRKTLESLRDHIIHRARDRGRQK